MSPARTIVAAAVCWLAAPAAVAWGALGDYCVGIERAGCTAAPTLTAALARPGRVRVFLGPGSYTADARDAGVPVQLVGAGIDDTVLREVELRSSGSKLSDASADRRLVGAGGRGGAGGARGPAGG